MKWRKINPDKLPHLDVIATDRYDVTESVYFGKLMKDMGNVYVQTQFEGTKDVTHYLHLHTLSNIEFE